MTEWRIGDLCDALAQFPPGLRLRFGVIAQSGVRGGTIMDADEYELKREPDGSIQLVIDAASSVRVLDI